MLPPQAPARGAGGWEPRDVPGWFTMRPAPLLIAGLTCIALTGSAVAQDAGRPLRAAQARAQYFVEFRARSGGMLGHTFIVYGRMDGRGRALDARYAGLYPHERYEQALMTFGPLVTATAYVGTDKADRTKPIIATYRRRLNAEEFARLQYAVHRLQTGKPRWHFIFQNCNDFAGQIAREIGLWIPPNMMMPKAYIRGLRALNGPGAQP